MTLNHREKNRRESDFKSQRKKIGAKVTLDQRVKKSAEIYTKSAEFPEKYPLEKKGYFAAKGASSD